MHFWTVQRRSLVDIMLQNEGSITPDFSKYVYDNDHKPKAYRELLKYYNSHSNKQPVKGLIFGIVSTDVCQIDEPKDLVEFWECNGAPGGIFPSPYDNDYEDFYLLCVEIDDDTFLAPIRFYDFTDMLFFLTEGTPEEVEFELSLIPRIFLNSPGDAKDIVQSHIPAIFYKDLSRIYEIQGGLGFHALSMS